GRSWSFAYASGDEDRARLKLLDPGLGGDFDPSLRLYACDRCVGHHLNAARSLDQVLGIRRADPDAPEVEQAKAWMAAVTRESTGDGGSFEDKGVANVVVAECPRRCQSR